MNDDPLNRPRRTLEEYAAELRRRPVSDGRAFLRLCAVERELYERRRAAEERAAAEERNG